MMECNLLLMKTDYFRLYFLVENALPTRDYNGRETHGRR